MLVLLRSVLFNICFYLNLCLHLLAALPTFFLPRRAILRVAQFWARTNLFLLRVICGIRIEWRGLERIPPGALLVAAKHQSVWETFALLPLFDDPTFILKRELMWLPLFGWYARKAAMIPVDRRRGSQALFAMSQRAREAIAAGRQIIIFPEGTRRPPGAEPRYKQGAAHLYGELGVTCLPIALNSGLFWPRRSFCRYPGTIVVEVLDPIAPGLDRRTFAERLEEEIETATARLVAMGERELAGRGIEAAPPAHPS